ncbi:unnamed protein product [Caenorhabditis nigoni]
MLIELFFLSTLFVSLFVGCKKKNEAGKLKPRNLDGTSAATPTGAPVKKESNESNVAATAPNKDEPEKKEDIKMAERPADDNETINDAKSNWGAVV